MPHAILLLGDQTNMILRDRYMGGDDPFEGDRTVTLRSLPAGARVTKATVTVKPIKGSAPGAVLFLETLTFASTAGAGELLNEDWGVTKAPETLTNFVEVDFHARRTLAAVEGSNITDANVQVDMGGTYVEINERGAIRAPGDNPFKVPADGKLPGLALNKFKLTRAAGTLNVTKVTIRSVPTNVSVRLGQMPPFWTRLGELTATAGETSPDFAPVLNAFLGEARVENEFYVIPFVVHSDIIARLDVEVAIEFLIEQPVLPSHLPELTSLYGFSTLPGTDEALTTTTLPRAAIPVTGRTSAQIRGEFQPSRIALGPVGDELKTTPVVVSPECTVTQPLRSDKEIAVTGVDLPLANTEPGIAGLNVAIQDDADGKPSGEVIATAEVRVQKPLPGQSAWGTATLPAPFRVQRGERYWLVLQSRIGQAEWGATVGVDEGPPLQCSRDGGLSWREATAPGTRGALSALFRLRDSPERFRVPVQLQIGKGASAVRRRLDEFAALGRVEFRFDFAEKLAEHLSKPKVASPCGKGELITNGSFDQPPHDDATRRLFGFDAIEVPSGGDFIGPVDLSRGVDLSVLRFIILSVAKGAAVRIDCAGANPARTTLNEVIEAINRVNPGIAFKHTLASGPVQISRLGLHGPVTLHPWHKAEVPQGWHKPAETGGRIWRLKLPTTIHDPRASVAQVLRPEVIAAALEASGVDAAVLAQRVPVASGCAYVLRFRFNVSTAATLGLPGLDNLNTSYFADPRWEVHWFDATGKLIREDRTVLASPDLDLPALAEAETRLAAPIGSAEAETRFVQSSPGFLILDDVSFTPTTEALANGGLRFWHKDPVTKKPMLIEWTPVSGWIDAETQPTTNQIIGARLRGDGPEDAMLSQPVEVIAGRTYELRVRARPMPPPSGDPQAQLIQQRARVELRWLGDGPVGAAVILPLDGRDFSGHAWAGAAPVGARQAEVRLVQPRGRGDLLVESVSLSLGDLVSVPLIFLAEAPGELTVSDLHVAYDLPEPPAPDIFVSAGPRRQALVRAAQQSLVEAVTGPVTAPAAPPPITDIDGIGEKRAERLAAIGIDSIEKLAAATPEIVAPVLGGVPMGVALRLAAQLIKQAKKLLGVQEESGG